VDGRVLMLGRQLSVRKAAFVQMQLTHDEQQIACLLYVACQLCAHGS
jgi:hypothetical protein